MYSQNKYTYSFILCIFITIHQISLADSIPDSNEIGMQDIYDIPSFFDLTIRYPNCINNLLDQGICQASSFIVAASLLSDRLCIKTNGKTNLNFSPKCNYKS